MPPTRRLALPMLLALAPLAHSARAGLDDYVKKPDPAFAWTLATTKTAPGGFTVHRIDLTSQKWQGITWTHVVSVVEPPKVDTPDAMVLFISGGKIGDGPRTGDLATATALAAACRARVAILPQVPNQPLLGDKTEDALIAATFLRYLDTGDEEWPLLFPMVKSAVKAMDALQAFGAEKGKPVARFVVTGASKRGWTTWLTAAVDPRVVGIAPMVIPTLNMPAQNKHQLENFGGFSEQIRDYSDNGLTGKRAETAAGKRLTAMVDPYTYRARFTMPKLQINGTNDPYWTLDSMNLFWDDLVGPKWVVYLPNAGHSLDQHRDYAVQGVAALFRDAVGKQALPEISWTQDDAPDGSLRLHVRSKPAPTSAQVWTATSNTLDFRKSPWTSRPVAPGAAMETTVARPEKGNIALFLDLEYNRDGAVYHLSTQIRQTERKPAP